jgi:hypothetical protein
MTDPAEVNRISEETRAEMRATLAGSAGEYVLVIDRCRVAEQRYAQDPDSEDRQAEAKSARADLEDERKRFDDAVAAAKRKRTLTLRDAFKEVEL